MPKQFDSAGKRRTTGHSAPTGRGGAPKPGSRSRGHRGWRPSDADAAPAKRRWTHDDRKARAIGASARTTRDAEDGRPDWTPPASKGAARAPRVDRPWSDRPARSGGGDRDRSRYDDRPRRQERPRSDDRPARGERPAHADRPRSEERPARAGRPRWDERPARTERGERPARIDRPSRAERPRFDERPPRHERDRDRAERPAFVEDVVLPRLEAEAVAADAGEGLSFGDLGIGPRLTDRLADMGAVEPFPIQAATIPVVLEGRDVLGRGRTGSGKTIAFGAPLIERLLRLHREAHPDGARGRSMGRLPRAVILAPTRELAQQIDRTVQPLARTVGLYTIAIVGGVPYARQLTGLRRGVDIVIGTPGRIEDLVDKGELDLSEIQISVLDEADHMCDLGFLDAVQRILRLTPEGSQRLLFSATLDTAVEALVAEFLHDPSVHEVAGEDQASSTIEHRVLVSDAREKRRVITELVQSSDRSIVFTRTRAFAEDVALVLEDAGIESASLHGDLNQAKRQRSLQRLERGSIQSLVATDVAARGIHVDDIDLVIQADMPDDHKTYLHRAGRTGRAGAQGTVITIIAPGRRRRMEELLEKAGIVAEWEWAARPERRDRPERDRTERFDRDQRADRTERAGRASA